MRFLAASQINWLAAVKLLNFIYITSSFSTLCTVRNPQIREIPNKNTGRIIFVLKVRSPMFPFITENNKNEVIITALDDIINFPIYKGMNARVTVSTVFKMICK